jgi:broad specificity phosphatase PhoE
MEPMTIISLVRHGLVDNPQGIVYGRLPDFNLSEEGRRQAAFAREYFEHLPIAAVFTSPILRAQQTSDIILQYHPHLNLQTSELLTEVHTSYEGKSLRELETQDWDFYDDVQPPYETPQDIFNRSIQFMEMIRDEYHQKHVVAVTHGDVIAFLMIRSQGFTVTGESKRKVFVESKTQEYPMTGSITTFAYRTAYDDAVPNYVYLRPYEALKGKYYHGIHKGV